MANRLIRWSCFANMKSVCERGRPRKHCPAMHSRSRSLWPSWLVAPDFPVNYLTSGWEGRGIISCSPSESVRNFDQLRSEVSRAWASHCLFRPWLSPSLIGNAYLAPWERNYGCSIYCASPYLLQLIMLSNQGDPTIMNFFLSDVP